MHFLTVTLWKFILHSTTMKMWSLGWLYVLHICAYIQGWKLGLWLLSSISVTAVACKKYTYVILYLFRGMAPHRSFPNREVSLQSFPYLWYWFSLNTFCMQVHFCITLSFLMTWKMKKNIPCVKRKECAFDMKKWQSGDSSMFFYLQGVENGENPCKNSGILINSQQTKHPSEAQYWQKDQCSNQQFPVDVCNWMIVDSTVFISKATWLMVCSPNHNQSTLVLFIFSRTDFV